jgi:hypothetical protein
MTRCYHRNSQAARRRVAPFEVNTMAEYRAYTVGLDGHFISFEALVCRDDGEAIAKAQCLVDGHDVEVWSGERFIIRLEHEQK